MEHHRPKACDPHEGLLKVERREFRCLRFRFQVWVLGFVFQVLGLGFRF